MENESELENVEPIVIPDECGDTLWDAVLEQEETLKRLFNE